MQNSLREGLAGSKLLSGVRHLAGATLFSQLLGFLMLPVLTRLYPAESFGVLSMYLSVLSILVVISCLNYEVAITAPEQEDEALSLFALCCLLVAGFGAGFGALLLLVDETWWQRVGVSALLPYWYMLPLGLVLIGVFNACHYYALRVQAFRLIGRTHITQALLQALTQGTAGVLALGPLGLLFGDMMKMSSGLLALYLRVVRVAIAGFGLKSILVKMKAVALRYKQYPLFGLPSDLLITLGVALPAIFLGNGWGLDVLGVFTLAFKVMDVPVTLVGKSVGKVYLSEAMKLKNQSLQALAELYITTTRQLTVIALVLVPLVAVALYYLAGFIFGEQWSEIGLFALCLIPSTIARFIVSPLSQTSAVVERQDAELLISGLRVALIAAAFWVSQLMGFTALLTVMLYAMTSAFMYLVFFLVYLNMVRTRPMKGV